jgi:hypothetical protein
MRRSLLALALLAAACVASEAPTVTPSPDGAPAVASRPAADQNTVDTVGLPDLVVDAKATQNNWLVRVEDFPADFCSVIEGGVTPGTHAVLRFTVTTPNIGNADVFVGSPLKHMDPNGDGSFADQDGLFEFASCHGHFHFQHYATYQLLDASGKEWKAAKRGFCMLDTDPYNVNGGDGTWNYRNCGTATRDGFQGISDGWADTYVFKLGGQYFVLDGGDGQPGVPPGVYRIRVTVNPPYAADRKGNCPRVKDPDGTCRQFAESNYANNVGEATVIIPDHPGRQGYGTIKNAPTLTAADEIDHKGQ